MKNLLWLVVLLSACSSERKGKIISLDGELGSSEMGITLIHEHILVDFIGADSTGYHRWNRDSVTAAVLPYLLEAKERGVKTLIECTPAYLGRDPRLLAELSKQSGIRILTNTGYYGAVGNKYLPPHAFTETAQQLAERWIAEFDNGIEDTGVRPAFMKISVGDSMHLSEIHQKLVKATAIAHLETGMVIASHTGPAAPAMEEIAILEEEGVHPSAFIWVHAQAEQDPSHYVRAAEKGAWISLDGVAWDVKAHFEKLVFCKENDLLENVLISHDAGWYKPGEPGGGEFMPFVAIFEELIPMLKEAGFTPEEIDLLLVKNPAKAFSLGVKKVNQG